MSGKYPSVNGVVFNIQRYCIDDGPGIRTTVFLKGCPLKCLWCANPESQSHKPEVGHRETDCIQCGRCIETCENGAIGVKNGRVTIDKERCINCGKCVAVCSTEALRFLGKEMSVDDVFQIIEKDTIYYKLSNGGVTVSGGEPFAQAEFTSSLLQRCRDEGLHTCVETCGVGTEEQVRKVLPYASLVLFDLKHLNDTIHQKLTKGSNSPILHNLQFILQKDIPVVIRIPLIPGYNDATDEITAMACKLDELNRSLPIEVMPYHNFGEYKYNMLFRTYELSHVQRPSKEKLRQTKELFESKGYTCVIR